MRENGSTNRKKATEQRFFQMDVYTKGNTSMGKLEAQELTFGLTVNATMVNGLTVLNMDPECGEGRKVIATKGSGNSENHKAMEFIHGQMVITTKVNSKNV